MEEPNALGGAFLALILGKQNAQIRGELEVNKRTFEDSLPKCALTRILSPRGEHRCTVVGRCF